MKFVWLMAGLALVFLGSPSVLAQNAIVITPLLSSTVTASGQPIVLPQRDAEVVASIYDIAPGATLPVHQHPFPRLAYVLSGSLRVTNLRTGHQDSYKLGDFVVEAIGQWHTGSNVGDQPLKLLVIDIVKKDQTNTVLHK